MQKSTQSIVERSNLPRVAAERLAPEPASKRSRTAGEARAVPEAKESLAELAHDARNMMTALGLYCDLLEEPGVLATEFSHYGRELRLVARAGRRLVEKLAALDLGGLGAGRRARLGAGGQQIDAMAAEVPRQLHPRWAIEEMFGPAAASGARPAARNPVAAVPADRWDPAAPRPIVNAARELKAARNLLAALAGPSIALSLAVEGAETPVRLNSEDLIRVLVNLVKNAAEAIGGAGSIRIGLSESGKGVAEHSGRGSTLSLTVEDTGPGISHEALERIFDAGFTTRGASPHAGGRAPAHRGLGLSISRSIVEAAGGRIFAANCEGEGAHGARIEIVLPALTGAGRDM